jgi:hypothetical protein
VCCGARRRRRARRARCNRRRFTQVPRAESAGSRTCHIPPFPRAPRAAWPRAWPRVSPPCPWRLLTWTRGRASATRAAAVATRRRPQEAAVFAARTAARRRPRRATVARSGWTARRRWTCTGGRASRARAGASSPSPCRCCRRAPARPRRGGPRVLRRVCACVACAARDARCDARLSLRCARALPRGGTQRVLGGVGGGTHMRQPPPQQRSGFCSGRAPLGVLCRARRASVRARRSSSAPHAAQPPRPCSAHTVVMR